MKRMSVVTPQFDCLTPWRTLVNLMNPHTFLLQITPVVQTTQGAH